MISNLIQPKVLHEQDTSIVTLEDGLVRKEQRGVKKGIFSFPITAKERVDREIQALNLLGDVYGVQQLVGRESDVSYFSEYIPSITLKSFSGKLPKSYFDELREIHANCIKNGVYRLDYHKRNVLVTAEQRPAVIDFEWVLFADEAKFIGKLIENYGLIRIMDLQRQYSP